MLTTLLKRPCSSVTVAGHDGDKEAQEIREILAVARAERGKVQEVPMPEP